MVVQHNLTAMNSNRMLGLTTKTQSKSTEKLSSGYKINRAADDAAGLAISEKMRKQIRGLTQASLNAQDGISAVQTAEGALTEVHDMLQRMNELAIKAGNGTMSETDRQSIQDEMDQLVTEIDRVSETTKFNETYLLKGNGTSKHAGEVSAHIGDVAASTDKLVDATITKAKGNIFSGTFDDASTTKLDTGTEDKATITYLDDEGNRRTKDVTFKTGSDAKATAKNFAEAINNDDTLKKIFTASSSSDGKISIESKLDGNKTDATKNAVQKIVFESQTKASDPTATGAAARLNQFTEGEEGVQTAATGESYAFEIGTSAALPDTATASIANPTLQLKDGNSITINGKTYTYDAGKTDSNANTFKTLKDLQDLLGKDYEVSAQITGTKVVSNYAKSTDNPVSVEEMEYSTSIKASGMDKAFGSIVASTDFEEVVASKVKADNSASTAFKDLKLTINITEKANVEAEADKMNFSLQVGADTTQENKISVDIESMSAKSLGINGITVTGKDSTNADAAVDTIAAAIAKVSSQRSALGAVQNRLEHTINNLDNVVENTTSAEAQIRDTDMASEMVKYSNNNILAQAGQAMLAQANQANQGVLSLLG